jgi:DNA-binding NtrC family response regulator
MTIEDTTVAVFDDDATLCEILTRLLRRKGFICVSANTLTEAAMTMGRSRPEIVIADFEFHCGMNIALMAETLQKTADQVIILTSHDKDEILKEYPMLSFATFRKKGQPLRKIVESIGA